MDDLLRYNGADWTGFVLTLLSLHMLGDQKRAGFVLGAVACVAWAAFSVQAGSTATLIANIAFLGLNVRGWAKWRPVPRAPGDAEGAGGQGPAQE